MDKLTLSSCVSIYSDDGRIWLRVTEIDGSYYDAELGAIKVEKLITWLLDHEPHKYKEEIYKLIKGK